MPRTEVDDNNRREGEHSLPLLVGRLREGCVLHPKRWSGDAHFDRDGSVNEPATDDLMEAAADAIERLHTINHRDQKCGPSCEHTAEEHWAFDFGYDMGARIGRLNTINAFRKGTHEWQAFEEGVYAGELESDSSNAVRRGCERTANLIKDEDYE